MIKIIIAFLAGSAWLLSGCAQYPSQTDWPPQQAGQRPLANVSYASLASLPYIDNSIILRYGEDKLQYGRLYLPPKAHTQTKVPLVIFIHGGCWLNAYDISHSRAFSQAVASAGFAVWSVEYRRTGDEGGGWPGTFNDVLQALQFSQHGLNAYAVDKSSIVIAGHSAGGQLALLAAGRSYHQAETAPLPPVKGVIGLAAITNVLSYGAGTNSCQRATGQFLGGTAAEQPLRYQQASPQLQPMHPATLLLQGSVDTIVPLAQATASNMPYQVVADAGHFDWIHPHTRAYKQFIASLQELFAQ
ncbi:alpha/beta hydrolase [Arsukibacterium sp.]|uniref:alpha/beta hydrolase n=1 Tax=Arsukibacterium sp. TaxID=1977258 RepID=UPI00299EB8DD|nr:alpha/beta hydrolase [Arsukibacterium sp.]MDX1678934.1 alpha/beta hydrolase [Arsukibacterium sp.]